jgi:lysyl-tRNA synthetase, class II
MPDVDYPYAFDRTHTAEQLHERFGSLEPGSDGGERARVAGRIRTVRTHGKVAFADLEDRSGRVQLFAQQTVLGGEGMEAFSQLKVGDIAGAEGQIVMTRRGELSVRVESTTVLAKCLKPMPEKWHGMTDVEARHRHRYLDLLVNPETRRALAARAIANAAIRRFFDERGFVEVETPLLQPIASGAVARPFVTHLNALDMDLYLRVAPELYLKRLLVGGQERVYELNRSFRNEGVSARHSPEFSMLEAYEAYVDYNTTMTLVEELVRAIAVAVTGSETIAAEGGDIDLGAPFRRISMFDAIRETTEQDLEEAWKRQDAEALRTAAADAGVEAEGNWPAGVVLAEIFEATAERKLWQPTFVTGFPKDVSPLAKDHRNIDGFTEHADLVVGGIELAPVYSELNDPAEQRRRFEQQAHARERGAEEVALPDEDFLEALGYGMPPAGGFGLGIDRLLSLLLGLGSIREAILFPVLKPER